MIKCFPSSEDVRYTIEQAGTKKNVAWNATKTKELVNRVEAIPPNKMVAHLNNPWAVILYHLSSLNGTIGMIQPKKIHRGERGSFILAHPIGSGPYKLLDMRIITQRAGGVIKATLN